jgi:hypothetical protein
MNSSIRHSENILDAFNMQSADFFWICTFWIQSSRSHIMRYFS